MNIFVLGMGNPEVGLGAMIAIFVIGCLTTYLAARNASARELDALHDQLTRLSESVRKLAETTVVQLAAQDVAAQASVIVPMQSTPAATEDKPVANEPLPTQEIPEEVLVIIAAAVAAFAGKKARVRHTRLVQPAEANAWAQQGRVFVQASHNLGVSHHM